MPDVASDTSLPQTDPNDDLILRRVLRAIGARRVLACVKACSGLPIEALDAEVVTKLLAYAGANMGRDYRLRALMSPASRTERTLVERVTGDLTFRFANMAEAKKVVRTIIAAMYEPTESMIRAGIDAGKPHDPATIRDVVIASWQAMIDDAGR